MKIRNAVVSCLLAGIGFGGTAMAQLPVVDISLEHDAANNQVKVYLRANDYDFGEVMSSLVFTVRWPEASAATLAVGTSPWCPPPSSAFNLAPSPAVTPGNGYRYRTWISVGLSMLADSPDDGGCGQTLLPGDWVHIFTINVNGDPGGTEFVIAEDAFTQGDNRSYYISLNGVDSTGSVFTFTTEVAAETASPAADFRIAPNPAAAGSWATVVVDGEGPWALEVIDAAGRAVRSEAGSQWPPRLFTAGLPSGMYAVRLIAANKAGTSPLVIGE